MKEESSENTTPQVSGGGVGVGEGQSTKVSGTDLETLAKSLGIPLLSVAPKDIDKATLTFIAEETAKRHNMAVFSRDGKTVSVGMLDPEDSEALNVLRFLAEKEHVDIEISLVSKKVLDEIFEQYRGTAEALKEAILSLENDESSVSLISEGEEEKEAKDREVLQDAPIARLVESIVKHAIEARASDIHIEPTEEGYRVRFRVDGLLHSSLVFPLPIGRAVVARIKILSNLKIDEKRKPQDGRFRVEHAGKTTDLRISTFPVVDGEKVVMRILEKNQNIVDFSKMGLWGRNGELLRKKIMDPYGIILMTGPTGSGKSTTLYSFLQILNQDQRNIVTLEDPVEFSIAGINQSQVKPEIGYTFASGLRSILRQDPNVIMVGEIRDGETAELAIHSALTGHLVLSTLHTNNAIGSIPRLVDMGIEPFLLASSLQVVAAQRLVRRICPECKVETELTPVIKKRIEDSICSVPQDELKKYEYDVKAGVKLYQGKGCEKCGNTGYKGRIAICEAFEINEEAKRVITDEQANEGKLYEEARRQGMLLMRQDGILKALRGMTSITEVERVTEGDLLVDEE
ncbi:MAG: type II/IV secretion system protein [Candidatus Moranbacteria bacterium]|nr:type II/IV secretion system protein [Candidatus Moranbacteria bacterium]